MDKSFRINSKHLGRLDHLRVFACIWVMLGSNHLGTAFLNNISGDNIIVRNIMNILKSDLLGVDVFFVLSAFLFTVLCNGGKKAIIYRKFIYNRMLRIFPLLIFAFLIMKALTVQFSPQQFINILSMDFYNINRWGTGFIAIWTLGVELQFYLLFPLLIIPMRENKLSYFIMWIVILILVKMCMVQIHGKENLYYVFYTTTIARFDQFLIGMILGKMYIDNKFKFLEHQIINSVLLVIALFLLAFYCKYMYGVWGDDIIVPIKFTIQGILMGALIILYMYSNLFSFKYIHKSLVWVAQFTYGMYLFHVFIGIAIKKVLPTEYMVAFAPITIVASIIFAMLTKKYIEDPFLQRKVNYYKSE